MNYGKLLGIAGSAVALLIGLAFLAAYIHVASRIPFGLGWGMQADASVAMIASVAFPVAGVIGALLTPAQVPIGVFLKLCCAVGWAALFFGDPLMMVLAGVIGTAALMVAEDRLRGTR